MIDAEIIKALECCSQNRCTTDGCPLAGNRICMTLLTTYALDLINRLKSENDDLKRDTIPKLQSSLDRANKYGIETEKENERLKAEIERLKKENHRFADIGKMYSEIRAEAYKEFAEQVQEEIADALHSNYKARGEKAQEIPIYTESEFLSYCSGKIDCLRGLADFIDNLVKEMEGDSNERS